MDEAVVFLVRTPPPVRYFSVIPYLHERTEDIRKTLFASVDEPINNLKIATASPTGEVFNELSVFVLTPDRNMYDAVVDTLGQIGFPARAVQLLTLAPEMLKLGKGQADDSFTLLMRVALADAPSQLDDYILSNPVRVVRLTPTQSHTAVDPLPNPDLPAPGSVAEPNGLALALSKLVKDIKSNYAGSHLTPHRSVSWAPIGEDCITDFEVCGGDNYDALYTLEAKNLLNDPNTPDFVIVAGVNHKLLNKALYINHSISDPIRNAGVASFSDKDLQGSAAYHAGLSGSSDLYQYLYAYMISSNCGSRHYCLQVPLAGVDGDIGIKRYENYDIVGRIYLDPATTVRPDEGDIILPWILK